VKPVEDAVCDRRENDASDEDNRQAAVKRIQARKELAAKVTGVFTGPIPPRSIDALRNASIQLRPSRM